MILALRSVIFVMESIVLLRVFCELFVKKRDSVVVRFIISASETLLIPVRNLLSKTTQGKKPRVDLSPLVLMIILVIINLAIRQNLM